MNEIDLLERNAVDAAVKAMWKEAASGNKKILTLDKNNVPALLRLGFAKLQLSEFSEAKKYYQKALKLQPVNSVAKENIERLKILLTRGGKKSKKASFILDPNLFLEIPGKTRNIVLVNLGQKNVLAQQTIGQEVYVKPKKRRVEVRTKTNDYIGSLPDDISKRLLLFLKAESVYSVFIKESSSNRVIVFIREEKKGKKVAQYLSFPRNSQAQIKQMTHDKDSDDDVEDIAENELDKMAEALTNEDKDYLPYASNREEDEDVEE